MYPGNPKDLLAHNWVRIATKEKVKQSGDSMHRHYHDLGYNKGLDVYHGHFAFPQV
jgi:hypothetical protein